MGSWRRAREPCPAGPARIVLADVVPPIALGPLDGRYRGAVAPLVDHLSEAALNANASTSRSSG